LSELHTDYTCISGEASVSREISPDDIRDLFGPVSTPSTILPPWARREGDRSLLRRDNSLALARRLPTLLRSHAALEIRLGQGLRLFRDRCFDTRQVGERGVGDLARNRLGFSGGQASELSRIAEGLEHHPLLARAHARGRLGRSQVRELLRVVTPETERGWLRVARRCTVAELRRVVRDYLREAQKEPLEGDGEEEHVQVSFLASFWERATWAALARETVEIVAGARLPIWKVVEYLCAEFASKWGHLVPSEEEWGEDPDEEEEEDEAVTKLPAVDELWEVEAEDTEEEEEEPLPPLDLPDPSEARSARELLAILLSLVRIRQSLDWQIGRLLSEVFFYQRWPDFDCDSFRDFVERHLGMGIRKAQTLVALDMKLEERPALEEAYRKGELGWNKAHLVARIASRATEKPWIERALKVTVRRLEAEVRVMQTFDEMDWLACKKTTRGLPPSPELLRELGVLPGGYHPLDLDALVERANVLTENLPRRLVDRHWPWLRIRFRAPPEVARYFWRTIMGVGRLLELASVGECLIFLLYHFARTYQEEEKRAARRHPILDRDRWLCSFPGCSGRVVQSHHRHWKSRGGSNERSNLLALCPAHHASVHKGWVDVEGKAPHDLIFRNGSETWRDDERIEG
jgi:hypothetical protein